MLTEDTIAALSTAPGVGAIAVLRLSGNEALHIANSIFQEQISQKQIHIHCISE